MKTENKKTIILTVIAIVTLLISILGAANAYFTTNTDNTFGTPKIEAITGKLGNVKLVSVENNLYLNLSRNDMMEENKDSYYAVTDQNVSPIGWNAVKSEKNITEDETYKEIYSQILPTIGYIEVDGTETYDCDYTFEVTIEGNMKEALSSADQDSLVFGLVIFNGELNYVEYNEPYDLKISNATVQKNMIFIV